MNCNFENYVLQIIATTTWRSAGCQPKVHIAILNHFLLMSPAYMTNGLVYMLITTDVGMHGLLAILLHNVVYHRVTIFLPLVGAQFLNKSESYCMYKLVVIVNA